MNITFDPTNIDETQAVLDTLRVLHPQHPAWRVQLQPVDLAQIPVADMIEAIKKAMPGATVVLGEHSQEECSDKPEPAPEPAPATKPRRGRPKKKKATAKAPEPEPAPEPTPEPTPEPEPVGDPITDETEITVPAEPDKTAVEMHAEAVETLQAIYLSSDENAAKVVDIRNKYGDNFSKLDPEKVGADLLKDALALQQELGLE